MVRPEIPVAVVPTPAATTPYAITSTIAPLTAGVVRTIVVPVSAVNSFN